MTLSGVLDEGGNPQPIAAVDTVATMLAPDEYVIPANVVKAKGTDFFDKMKEKYSEQGAI